MKETSKARSRQDHNDRNKDLTELGREDLQQFGSEGPACAVSVRSVPRLQEIRGILKIRSNHINNDQHDTKRNPCSYGSGSLQRISSTCVKSILGCL